MSRTRASARSPRAPRADRVLRLRCLAAPERRGPSADKTTGGGESLRRFFLPAGNAGPACRAPAQAADVSGLKTCRQGTTVAGRPATTGSRSGWLTASGPPCCRGSRAHRCRIGCRPHGGPAAVDDLAGPRALAGRPAIGPSPRPFMRRRRCRASRGGMAAVHKSALQLALKSPLLSSPFTAPVAVVPSREGRSSRAGCALCGRFRVWRKSLADGGLCQSERRI
jgi:hypothetical protein